MFLDGCGLNQKHEVLQRVGYGLELRSPVYKHVGGWKVFHHGHLVTLESFSACRHTAEKEKEDGIKMEKGGSYECRYWREDLRSWWVIETCIRVSRMKIKVFMYVWVCWNRFHDKRSTPTQTQIDGDEMSVQSSEWSQSHSKKLGVKASLRLKPCKQNKNTLDFGLVCVKKINENGTQIRQNKTPRACLTQHLHHIHGYTVYINHISILSIIWWYTLLFKCLGSAKVKTFIMLINISNWNKCCLTFPFIK